MDNGQGVGIRLSNPMKRCRRKAGVSFHRVRRDSRFSGARGAAPCTERSDAGPRIADAVSGQGAAPQDARYMVVRLCIEVRPLFQRDFIHPLCLLRTAYQTGRGSGHHIRPTAIQPVEYELWDVYEFI